MAKLGKGDPKVARLLGRYLDDARHCVRTAGCEALSETAGASAIELPLTRRGKEQVSSILRAIDDSRVKLRRQQNDLEKIRRQREAPQKQDRQLKERVRKPEDTLAPGK